MFQVGAQISLGCEERAQTQWVEAFRTNSNENSKKREAWAIIIILYISTPVGALAGNTLAPQWLGNKEYWTRAETVCLSLLVTLESVHLYVYLYVSEINSLTNITYPTVPVTYTPVKMQRQRNVFLSFCSSYQHLLQTPLTLIGLNWAQSQTSLLVFLLKWQKQLTNLR